MILKYKIKYLIIFLIIFTSCAYFSTEGRSFKRAKSYSSKGDYDNATNEAITSLLENRNYVPSIELIELVFPKAIKLHHKSINRFMESQDYYKWDLIVLELNDLISLVDNLESLDMDQTEIWLFQAETRDYYSELLESKTNAAEAHYQKGLEYMNFGDRDNLRLAATEFKLISLKFVDNYKDSYNLYNQCRESSAIKLAILPFENKSGKNKYGSIGNTISNEIITKLFDNQDSMEFLDIINRDQIDVIINEQKLSHSGLVESSSSIELGKIAGIHMMTIGEITQIIVEKPKKNVEKNHFTKKVVTGSESYQDSDGNDRTRKIYSDVHCTVRIHTNSGSATIISNYQIVDIETAQVLNSENIKGEYNYSYQWATSTGDTRALDWQIKNLINNKKEQPPNRQAMVMIALNQLTDKLYNKILLAVK